MSEPKKVKFDEEIPSCSKKPEIPLDEVNESIYVETINNAGGTVNIGVKYYQATANETQPKLTFQVKDPIHTFTGRKEFLEDLHETIQNCRKNGSFLSILSQTSSITGLGGIGKSETVRMYIKKFGKEYANIIWIDAEQPSEAMVQFISLASNKLGLAIKDHNGNSREFSHILEDIYEKLCTKPKVLLLVLDNAEAMDDTEALNLGIRKFLPAQTSSIEPPTVLITSRQQYWDDMNVITLGLWTLEESLEFIYKRLNLKDSPESKKDATELAELFDRLPIAIEVAVSVIAEQSRKRRVGGSGSYGIQNLVKEYSAGGRNILRKKARQNTTQGRMQVLLTVTLEKIKAYDEGELAIRILAFMAYLSPTSIPKTMIHSLLRETCEEDDFDSALLLLVDYSIIQNFENEFTIHRVFQDVFIAILPDAKLRIFTATSANEEDTDELKIIDELTRGITKYISALTPTQTEFSGVVSNIVHAADYIIQHSIISQFQNYIEAIADFINLTHFEIAIKFYKALISWEKSSKELLTKRTCEYLKNIGEIFLRNAMYTKAYENFNEQLKEEIYAQTGQIIADEDARNFAEEEDAQNFPLPFIDNILKIKMNISLSLDYQGKKREALQLYFSLEKKQELMLGALHEDTLRTKMNIAKCHGEIGLSEESLRLYKIVEKNQETVLGLLHPDTLKTKVNLADCMIVWGKFEEALKLYEMVTNIQEKVHGPIHLVTLRSKMRTANCQRSLCKYEEALKLYYTVVEGMEKVIGHIPQDVLHATTNLADCLSKLGKDQEALEINKVLVGEREKVFGPRNIATLTAKTNTANCLSSLGRNEDALKLYNAVLDVQNEILGPCHKYTLAAKSNVAVCLNDLGNNDDALKVFIAIQEEQEKIFGPLHPYTLLNKMNTANCLSDLEKKDEALVIYLTVEKELCKVNGPEHPHTLLSKMNLGTLLCDQGKNEESLSLFMSVLELQEKVHGPHFHHTLITKMNTAVCLSILGRKLEALELYKEVEEHQQKILGPEHPHTFLTRRNIASHLSGEGEEKSLRIYFVD